MNERQETTSREGGKAADAAPAPGLDLDTDTGPAAAAGSHESAGDDFDQAQQEALVAIGHALIEHATSGVVALDLRVTQTVRGGDVDLDFDLSLARQSGLTLPAQVGDALVEAVQQLVLIWRAHGRDPWRTFSYQLTRGESGPRYTTEFSF